MCEHTKHLALQLNLRLALNFYPIILPENEYVLQIY